MRSIDTDTKPRPFLYYKSSPILLRQNRRNGHLKVFVNVGKNVVVLTCSGKRYRFGRVQASNDTIIKQSKYYVETWCWMIWSTHPTSEREVELEERCLRPLGKSNEITVGNIFIVRLIGTNIAVAVRSDNGRNYVYQNNIDGAPTNFQTVYNVVLPALRQHMMLDDITRA